MSSRRRASDLYQVDFVAALFSGFLLIWLANAAESEFASAPRATVTAVVVRGLIKSGNPISGAPEGFEVTGTSFWQEIPRVIGEVVAARARRGGPPEEQPDEVFGIELPFIPADAAFAPCLNAKDLTSLGLPRTQFTPCAKSLGAGFELKRLCEALAANKVPGPYRVSWGLQMGIVGVSALRKGAESELSMFGRGLIAGASLREASAGPYGNCQVAQAPSVAAIGLAPDPDWIPTRLEMESFISDRLSVAVPSQQLGDEGGVLVTTSKARPLNPTDAELLVSVYTSGRKPRCYVAEKIPTQVPDGQKQITATFRDIGC